MPKFTSKNKPIKKHTTKPQKINENNKLKSNKKPIAKLQGPQQQRHELQSLPTIHTLLSIAPQNRKQEVANLFSKIKPFLSTYLLKKQGSRVMQLVYKWGNQNIKKQIADTIRRHWKELIRSKYALYTISKVSKECEFTNLVDDAPMLQSSRQGANILQNFLKNYPLHDVSTKIRDKFIQMQKSAVQGQIKNQQILDNLAIKSIEKNYYQNIISKIILKNRINFMFHQEKNKIIQFLISNIANIVTDVQGIQLFIELVNCCSPKHKKGLLKLYKGNIAEIVYNNDISYVSVLKLLTETDDTVLLSKTLIPELLNLLDQMQQCKKIFALIFGIFSPRNHNFNVLGKHEHEVLHTLCKKPEEQRKKQLREYFYQPLIKYFKEENNLRNCCQHQMHCKIVVGVAKAMQQDNCEAYGAFIKQICQLFLQDLKSKITEHKLQQSLICNGNANKILKYTLLQEQKLIDFYCDEFARILTQNFDKASKTKASFILLAILQKGGRDYIKQEISHTGVKLQAIVAGQHFRKLM